MSRPTPVTRRSLLAVGILVLVALVSGVAWWGASATALNGVRVVYDAAPLRCAGAEVGMMPGFEDEDMYFDEQFHVPFVSLTPGMQCALRFHVVNEGWTDVVVDQITLLLFGADAGLELSDVFVNPNGHERVPSADGGELDAHLVVTGLAIPPGGVQELTAVFTYAGSTRIAECTSIWLNVPVVTVAALGAARHVQPPAEAVIGFHQPARECPVP